MNSIRTSDQYFKFHFKDSNNIVIDREEMKVLNTQPSFHSSYDLFFETVIGVYKIANYQFCAVTTQSEVVCEKLNIRKVTGYEVIQITKGETNTQYQNMIKKGLSHCFMYYSTDRELSNTLQEQTQYKLPREKFVWNWEAKQNTIDYHLEYYVQNFIAGNIETFQRHDYDFILISRRSTAMAGTRYWTRGADDDGFSANFVETEQIVIKGDEKFAFVQVRGSVPLSWTQYPNLEAKPLIVFGDRNQSKKCCTRHFARLRKEYGRIVVVCLTESSRKKQDRFTRKYLKAIQTEQNVKTVHFPLISRCKGPKKYDELYAMVDEVGTDLTFSHFKENNPIKLQSSVIRTNCLDCLDRTNLAQSYLAQAMMQQIGIEIDIKFKEAWFDNGNSLSIQYAGTNARNGDVTTTGKRTFKGALLDAKSSTKRYFLGIFKDGEKQDEYEAVTKRSLPAPVKRQNAFIEFFVLLLLAITLLFKKGVLASRGALRNAAGCIVQKPRFKEIVYPDPDK